MSWWKLYANFSRRNLLLVIAATIVLTLIAVLLAVNLSSGEKKIQQSVERLYATDDPQFIHVMGVLLGPPVLGGNRYEVLLNGDQIFPSMLAAIRGARQTINFETYIYWSEAIGKEFADALTERARAGIKVNVLLDWIGSAKMEKNLVDEMKAAGVTVLKFHPPHWSHLSRLNNRTHRKLLIVDGKIGFTGGVGIAGQWTGNAQDPEHWRDTHFKSRARSSRRSSRCSWTTGSRRPARCCIRSSTSRISSRSATAMRRCSAVRRPAAARAWS
jgi:cardiolipin synthase